MDWIDPEVLLSIVALASAGVFAGLAAGLFGIGGGAIIVPALYFLLSRGGYDAQAMHVAIYTSLATIIVTSIRSVAAHNARGAVDWHVVRAWTPGIILGAVLGALLAAVLPGVGLTLLFGVVAAILAAQLFFGRPDWRLADDLPSGASRLGLSAGMGALSALMGIGGGTFGVSLMTVYGRPIHQAVGTAAGFGVAIGAPATLTAIWTGWGRAGLPPGSLGYVNLPAFALIAVFTVAMAPVGAGLAHRLTGDALRKAFALVLLIVGARMVYAAITG